MKTLTQPLKWHGGKSYLAPWIISHMPDHTHYVEPYFGGGSVLLQKDPDGISEVANDVNGELANFWSVIRCDERLPELQRWLEATPLDESMFNAAVQSGKIGGGTEIGRAFWFFVRARQSRQGLMKDFATLSRNRTRRGMNEQASSWLTAIDGLPDVHARLKRVVILNRDALDVIKQQDGPNTLFYCDPPYLHETRVTTSDYEYEMSRSQHDALLNVLENIKGKFLLSGYPSECYEAARLRNGWHRVEKQIDNKASSKKVKEKKTECLWANYDLEEVRRGSSA